MNKNNNLNDGMISISPLNSIDNNTITFRNKSFDEFRNSKTNEKIHVKNNSNHIIILRIKFKQKKYYCVTPCHYIFLDPGDETAWNGNLF
jgi:hypothetical protein